MRQEVLPVRLRRDLQCIGAGLTIMALGAGASALLFDALKKEQTVWVGERVPQRMDVAPGFATEYEFQNYRGYNTGATRFRDLIIGDGSTKALMQFSSNGSVTVEGDLIVRGQLIQLNQ